MANTANSVIQQALKMLQQTTVSGETAAGLFGGESEAGAPVIPGNDELLLWATDAQNRLTRTCLPIVDYAAVRSPAVGAQNLSAYSEITSPSGRILHTPTEVWIGTRQLKQVSTGYVRSNYYPSYLATGDPTAWCPNTGGSIGLGYNSTQPWFLINGYFLPKPLTTLTQELDPNLNDYAQIAMWAYVALQVAIANQDNSVLSERIVPCTQRWVESAREIYTRLISNDPALQINFVPVELSQGVINANSR